MAKSKLKSKFKPEELSRRLILFIPVERSKGKSVSQFLEHLGLSASEDSYNATRKATLRILADWTGQRSGSLSVHKEGRKNIYYWSNERQRHKFLIKQNLGSMPESQVVAFYLMENYFADILPPSFRKELSIAFNEAYKRIADNTKWVNPFDVKKEKLLIQSSGVPMQKKPIEDDAYENIFLGLEKEYVLQAEYCSIHNVDGNKKQTSVEEPGPLIIFSPQQIRLQGEQLKILVLMHTETGKDDYFRLLSPKRLRKVQPYKGDNFRYQRKQQTYIPAHLKLFVHTGLKNYFQETALGNNQQFEEQGSDKWLMDVDFEFPEHFNKPGPDLFFLTNMLLSFGRSVEVLEPDYLRDEMVGRVKSLNEIYLTDLQG